MKQPDDAGKVPLDHGIGAITEQRPDWQRHRFAGDTIRHQLTGSRWSQQEDCALLLGQQRWTTAELAALTEQRIKQLKAQGVQPGQVVLCPTDPMPEALLIQHAVTRLGAAVFPMAAGRPYPEQKARAERCGAEWLWQPSTKRALNTGVDTARSAAQSTDKRTAVPALLVETSGSSAGAKIVMLDDAALYASGTAINARLGLARGDLWLCCLPRQHVGGLAIGYRCALAGAAWRLLPRFEVEAVAQALTTEAVTHISLVPAMLQRLLEQDVPPAPTLRVALMGGQALDPNLAARAIAAGWPLYLGYGMTETFSQVAGDWIDASGRPEQGLQPLEGVQLRIAPEPAAQATSDLIGETPSHSAHTKGVLTLRGPMLMIGYASPSRRPGQGLQQGWLTSHDLAHVESTGKLHVLGRADDTLVIAGRNVQPSEVEARLTALEGLGEVAVLGLPDPVWGHRLIAVYTGPRATASVEAWCRSELPSPLRPRAFLRIESLPSRPSGKRDKQALMHLVGSHLPDVSTMASQ